MCTARGRIDVSVANKNYEAKYITANWFKHNPHFVINYFIHVNI